MLTILIVEDEPVTMLMLTEALTSEGYSVHQAVTAPAGIKSARATPPNLILMDLSLPGMDGITATKLLKQDPATQHIPVIAMTALAMEEDRKQAIAAGCAEYLTKPLSVNNLVRIIRQILNQGEI